MVVDYSGHQKRAVKLTLNSKTHILQTFHILRIHTTKSGFLQSMLEDMKAWISFAEFKEVSDISNCLYLTEQYFTTLVILAS